MPVNPHARPMDIPPSPLPRDRDRDLIVFGSIAISEYCSGSLRQTIHEPINDKFMLEDRGPEHVERWYVPWDDECRLDITMTAGMDSYRYIRSMVCWRMSILEEAFRWGVRRRRRCWFEG